VRFLENKFISKDLQSKKINSLLIILYILTICEIIWNLLTAFGIYITNSSSLYNPTEANLAQYHKIITLTIWMGVFALFGLLAVIILFKFRLVLWAFICSVISSFALILIPSLILTNSSMKMHEFIFRHCHIALIPIIALIIWIIGMKEYKKADKSIYTPIYK
jgi:hypothetical protein